MSDPTPPPDFQQTWQEISRESDEARQALQDAGSVRPCPMCGNDGWHVLYPGPVISIGTKYGPRTLPAYTLFCENCGFVRQHVKELVRRAMPKGGS